MRPTLLVHPLAALTTIASLSVAQTPGPALASPPFPRARFAVRAEPAFGVPGPFYTQLVGARVDARFTDRLALGAYLGYANLKGHDGRAHNVLPALELEYRPTLGEGSAFGLPLRFTTGYLPENGPMLRLSAGLSYAVSPNVDIVLDAFTPTFWIVRDRTVASLGAALEVSYAP